MSPEIDSPDRNHTTPFSAIQGSPFFDYLCNLSPLKPVDSVHVAQAFAHPPPVFSSPRVSLPKDLSLLNRLLHEGMEHEENKFVSSSRCEKGKEFTVPLSGCDIAASLISPVKGEVTSFDTIASDQTKSKDETMSPFFGCSPSKYVEQFLVDPMEEDFYVIDSSELRLKPTPSRPESSLVHLGNQQDATSHEWSGRTEMELFSGSNSLEEYLDADRKAAEADTPQESDETFFAAISEATMKTLDVRKLGQAHIENNEKTASFLSDLDAYHSHTSKCGNHSISSQTSGSHDQNSVDQVTRVLAFLHPKDSTCSIDDQMATVSTNCSKSSCQQVSKIPVNCDDGDGQNGALDNTPLPFEDSLGDAKPGAYLNMKLDPESNCPMEHHTALGCKASNQLQRGMRRRCLDFEALETCKNLRASSWNCTNLVSKTGTLSGYSHNSEKNAMSLMTYESSGTSDCKQLVITLKRETSADTRCFQSSASRRFSSCSNTAPDFASDKIECTVRKHGNSSVTVGMPSGIGLHLNSLATAMSLGHGVSMIKSAKGSVSMKGMRPLAGIKGASSDGLEGCSLSVGSDENLAVAPSMDFAAGKDVSVVENTRMDREELQSSGVAYSGVTKSTTCLRSLTVGMKPLQARLPLEAQERNKSPLDKKRPPLQDIVQRPAFGMGEEFNESSPKKRRKSATITDKQGCKRCNCKKSKCLKLYCDCFAAGVYCVEPCTCQECLNKPEHEDTVLGTRQQIESRNPLAFAPKIIREAASPPSNGKECSEVPTSARHKRGCNCKKSMCLKKYCECYQAAVGCSEGCRCEGCKNVYGKKEGSEEIQDKEAQLEELDKESSEEKLGVVEVRNDNMHLEQWHAKDLSPITPSFQYACQGRSTIKLRPSGKRHFTSEDTEPPLLFQPCAKPPHSPGKVLGSTKRVQGNGTAIHKTGLEFSASSGFMSKTERAGQFTSQWDGLRDICTVTPLSHLPLRPAANSISDAEVVEASPFHGQQNEILGSSSGQSISRYLCPGGSPSCFSNQSPVCTSDSITGEIPVNLQATPVTPAPSTTICNAGNKLTVDSKPCIKLHNVSGCAEDDTPDILKNNDSPMKILKARSPNQKRVSPPHNYGLKETTRRESRLPPGLRSGRKLIQQSMASFPPPSPLDEGAG